MWGGHCATMNAGAYVASGMGVTRRIGQGAVYLYTSPNARFEGTTAYTNRPSGIQQVITFNGHP